MKAVVVAAYGPPEVLVLREVEDPKPQAGQVVIGVAVAGINFVETMRRSGRMPGFGSESLPYIPGNEVGGRVIELGKGVDSALLGRLVVAQPGGTGGYAERVAVAAASLFPVPDKLDVREAVALLAQGRTALGVLRMARLAPGERVLIPAAGGGVGSLLVQLAHDAGAGTIIATARGQHKLDLARELGAHVAIDYGGRDWIERVRDATGGQGVDVAFDAIGGELGRGAFDLLVPGGRLVVFGFSSGEPLAVPPEEAARRGVEIIGFGGSRPLEFDIPKLIADALQFAAAGRLKPVIGQSYPLASAAEAHRAIEARATIGKTLLIP
jgi:NADPH2:quinone reductase